jgi:hypothetical protein
MFAFTIAQISRMSNRFFNNKLTREVYLFLLLFFSEVIKDKTPDKRKPLPAFTSRLSPVGAH